MASITPAASIPGTNGPGSSLVRRPARRIVSVGLTAEVCTRMSTSPGPTSGSGSSITSRTSGSPGVLNAIAFMLARVSVRPEQNLRPVRHRAMKRHIGKRAGSHSTEPEPVTWKVLPRMKDPVMMQHQTPPITWRPTEPQHTEMFRFAQWLTTQRGVDLEPLVVDDDVAPDLYRRLHAWSVSELSEFWDAVREYFGVLGDDFDTPALTEANMPGAVWYPHATLNFTENLLERTRKHIDQDDPALVKIDEDNVIETISWYHLRKIGRASCRERA